MFFAIGRISSGSDAGTSPTHATDSFSVISQALSRDIPMILGALAVSESRVPPQSGQISSFRNFSTRFMPCSSFTLFRALRTVAVAL